MMKQHQRGHVGGHDGVRLGRDARLGHSSP
jgi:hypothetical protein